MKLPQKLLLTTSLGLLLATSTLLADMSTKDIAKKAYTALDKRQSYAFDATVVNHSDTGENRHQVSVEVNRPNQLRVDVKGDIENRSSYLNNGAYTVYDHDKNMYVQLKTPKNLNKALDNLFDRFKIKAPLAQLVYTNMGERIKFDRSKNFGVVDLAGEPCDYLAFSTKTQEVHAWITRGDAPHVKHYRIIDKTSKSHAYKSITIQWKDASTVRDSDFVFVAPKSAKEAFIK